MIKNIPKHESLHEPAACMFFSFASEKGMEENRTADPPLSGVSQSPSKAGGSLGLTLYKRDRRMIPKGVG